MDRGWTPRRRIVIVEMRRLAHTSRGGHQRHRFVIPEAAATFPALDDAHETASEFLVEKCVQDGVNAGIRRA